MKNVVIRRLVQIGFLAVIATVYGAGSAYAQSLSSPVRATIPFDFTVADQKFPAGEYSFSRGQTTSGDLVLRVSKVEGNQAAFRLTSAVITSVPKQSATLIFHQYGDQYFLSQVWPAGGKVGRLLYESNAEREARAAGRTSNVAMRARNVSISAGQR